MSVEYPQLERETLTKTFTGVEVREGEQPLFSLFKGTLTDVEGDVARWDEVQPLRGLDNEYETRDSLATNTATGTVVPKSTQMVMTFKKREIKPEALRNLRAIGSEQKMSGEQKLALLIGDVKRRFVHERWERLIAGALQDNLSISIHGVTHTPDFGLPASHDLVAGTSWATASTDIDADVEALRRLIVQDSGRAPALMLCGRNIPSYLRKNSSVKEWFAGSPEAGSTLAALSSQRFRLYGMDWATIDTGYISAGSWVPHIPDDTVICMPRVSSDWFQLQRGSVMAPNGNIYGEKPTAGHVETFGEATWAKFMDEPPSAWYFLRWAGIAVPVFPSAYAVLDVTP
jgi:hypothetical protein